MTFKQILSRIRKVHPDAGETYVKALVNDALLELRKYKVSRQYDKISTVEDQRWYNIGDRNSDFKVDKIYAVYYKNGDGTYRKIPRLLDYDRLINMDEK
jgi:transcriptional regulator CtsR|tara:strand:+ start:73 stop:369 length:297 start_codon:yes stop_codon:yes gene_type:complete